jgi:very-short-patch-repair endonuclease
VEQAAQSSARRSEVRPTSTHPTYFVDFLCRERKVIIEVDGATHDTDNEAARDLARARELQRRGYRLFRVHNIHVYENMERVLDSLLSFIEEPHV